MVEPFAVELETDAGLLTDSGVTLLKRAGLDVDAISASKRAKRVMCRPCIDWSERRPHLAGALGAALCSHCLDKGWIRRIDGTRAVAITRKGEQGLRDAFGVSLS